MDESRLRPRESNAFIADDTSANRNQRSVSGEPLKLQQTAILIRETTSDFCAFSANGSVLHHQCPEEHAPSRQFGQFPPHMAPEKQLGALTA